MRRLPEADAADVAIVGRRDRSPIGGAILERRLARIVPSVKRKIRASLCMTTINPGRRSATQPARQTQVSHF